MIGEGERVNVTSELIE